MLGREAASVVGEGAAMGVRLWKACMWKQDNVSAIALCTPEIFVA